MDGSGAVSAGRIGPNAILQLITVLDACETRALRDRVMQASGVAVPPADAGMLPEADCAAVHRSLRQLLPDRADPLLHSAGLATGDYILAHRIPPLAQGLIRALPAPLGARLLVAAITRHAWTFAGTGSFATTGWRPLTFQVTDNPLIRDERARVPLCHWHAAVFQRLLGALVWPRAHVHEVQCAAKDDVACRFVVDPLGKAV